ncbi:hypothetical protein [Ulvibacter sp. MAR_2010_11]|uniref:hypothetical protein n=1 Tax=Ulvibacter sp. MAR_2010_11 TaxID=1250229 RepID=UPI0012FDFF25|nr:hypothetical protein [Ulvibacter sp. MAR_2010_11]
MKRILAFVFLSFIFFSCDNEPISEARINTDTIEVASELYVFMERISDDFTYDPINCIDFNYPFAFFIFDENTEYIEVVSVTSDEAFSEILGNLPDSYSISLNYPITGTFASGDLLEINNNDELKEAIDNCIKEEEKGYCDNTVINCAWKVHPLPGSPNPFEGDYFTMNPNGTIQYHTENRIYFGTWVSFHIGYELHLNTTLVADDTLENFWNEDWKVLFLNDETLEIGVGDKKALIKKDCSFNCDTGIYKVCEEEANPGFANFELQEFSVCNGIPGNHDGTSAVRLTYFETEMDAQNNAHEISAEQYTNIVNPQSIFVRIETLTAGDLLGIISFDIEAISCN